MAIIHSAFNQESSNLTVSTDLGYSIYNCEPFHKCYKMDESGGTGSADMLFCTHLVATVGRGHYPTFSSKRLRIYNTERNSLLCELDFPTTIITVKMNRNYMCVALTDQIYVYDVTNITILKVIKTTGNQKGLLSISLLSDSHVLVYPESNGIIKIFDLKAQDHISAFKVCKSDISAIQLNLDGTLLAVASSRGTLIRVFNLRTCKKIEQFRRGLLIEKVTKIAFDKNCNILIAVSVNTVHIFKLNVKKRIVDRIKDKGKRAFAYIKKKNVMAVSVSDLTNNVMLFTKDGLFEVWKVDFEKGGECVLIDNTSTSGNS